MATQEDMILVTISQEDTERSNYLYYIISYAKIKELMSKENVKESGAATLAIYGNGFGEFDHQNDHKGSIDYYESDLLHTVMSIKPVEKDEIETLRRFISISTPV